MDQLQAIESRYGIVVPAAYRAMHAEGRFTAGSENWLSLTDLEWLDLVEIAAYEFEHWQLAHAGGFVPFAVSARRDEWCWRLDWADGGELPIAFCEHGPEGYGYAPDFCGFLFCTLLEELSGSWVVEDEADARGQAAVLRSVDAVLPHLPAAWADQCADWPRPLGERRERVARRFFPRRMRRHRRSGVGVRATSTKVSFKTPRRAGRHWCPTQILECVTTALAQT